MSNSENQSTKIITVRLRVPALVLMAVLLMGGLTSVFVLGIMVGRGQMNDQLEALMTPAQLAANADSDPEKADAELESLIRAEDLKYQESLRQNHTPPLPAQAANQATLDAAGNDTRQLSGQTAQTSILPSSGQKFNYVYQVASYAREAQAKEIQTKLQGRGLEARIESTVIQNSSRFRVLIAFQGDESSVQSMRDMLEKDFKITGILPRGKTPLGG